MTSWHARGEMPVYDGPQFPCGRSRASRWWTAWSRACGPAVRLALGEERFLAAEAAALARQPDRPAD